MLLKGNNAEKIATTFIIFIILLMIYILISLAFRSITHSSVENMVKDGLGFAASCIAPIIAILLFNDWREQHNKQVRNEFALKVFNQYEKFAKEVEQAGYILIEIEYLLPEESRDKNEPNCIPIPLSDPIYIENKELFLKFSRQEEQIQIEFSSLLDTFRYFGIVTNQIRNMSPWLKQIISEFEKIHDEENQTYGEVLQFIDISNHTYNSYIAIRDNIAVNINQNILEQLQEN